MLQRGEENFVFSAPEKAAEKAFFDPEWSLGILPLPLLLIPNYWFRCEELFPNNVKPALLESRIFARRHGRWIYLAEE